MWDKLKDILKGIAFAAWVLLVHLLIATVAVLWAVGMKALISWLSR